MRGSADGHAICKCAMFGFVQVQGIPTNLEYLAAVAADKRFAAGGYAGLHLLDVLLRLHFALLRVSCFGCCWLAAHVLKAACLRCTDAHSSQALSDQGQAAAAVLCRRNHHQVPGGPALCPSWTGGHQPRHQHHCAGLARTCGTVAHWCSPLGPHGCPCLPTGQCPGWE